MPFDHSHRGNHRGSSPQLEPTRAVENWSHNVRTLDPAPGHPMPLLPRDERRRTPAAPRAVRAIDLSSTAADESRWQDDGGQGASVQPGGTPSPHEPSNDHSLSER